MTPVNADFLSYRFHLNEIMRPFMARTVKNKILHHQGDAEQKKLSILWHSSMLYKSKRPLKSLPSSYKNMSSHRWYKHFGSFKVV